MEIKVEVKGTTPAEILSKLNAAVSVWSSNTNAGALAKKTKAAKSAPAVEEADEDLLADDTATEDEVDEMLEAGSNDDLSFEDEFADEETEEVEEAPKKTKAAPAKTKTAKLTTQDVNNACLAYAKKHGRPETLKVLQKKFKVKSVNELKPDQYQAVIDAMKVK